MVPRARREAAAIFLGVVVRIDTVALDSIWMGGDSSSGRRPIVRATTVRYHFAVARTWKTRVSSNLVLMSYKEDTSCGRKYKLNNMYLVYAGRDSHVPGALMTYSCSRVKPEGDIQDDLQILGAGEPPSE
jgi:hypothetical protein